MNTNETQSEPSGQALPVGTQLVEFTIEKVLGSGGFGITYLAKDTSLGRQVVVKENLPAQFCYRDTRSLTVAPRHTTGGDAEDFEWSMKNFLREAETLASMDHPGIVRVLRKFEANGTAYFVMPFVQGVEFGGLIERRAEKGPCFTEDELRGLAVHMLEALSYLHDRGIFHRDIKPANILITTEGVPTLIDFGSARQRISDRSMTVIESAGYTPFEQLQSRGQVGPWSDLYALGATIAKAITFATPPKAADRMMGDPWTGLAAHPKWGAAYSQRLLLSLDKAMTVDPRDRWQCAEDWLAELRGEISQSRIIASVPILPEAANPTAEGSLLQQTQPAPSPPHPRKPVPTNLSGLPNHPLQTPSPIAGSPRKMGFGKVVLITAGLLGLIALSIVATRLIPKMQATSTDVTPKPGGITASAQAAAQQTEIERQRELQNQAAKIEAARSESERKAQAAAREEEAREERKIREQEERENLAGQQPPGQWIGLAAQGDAFAQALLARAYLLGADGQTKNPGKAKEWASKSASQEHPLGLYLHGRILQLESLKLGKASEKAIALFEKADQRSFVERAEAGGSRWMEVLGSAYYSGIGVAQNRDQAGIWFAKAAEQGDAPAMYALACCFRDGTGLASDAGRAFSWFSRAANLGEVGAMTAVGDCYRDGLGVAKNDSEPIKWYRKAAVQGESLAINNIGVCYHLGKGTPQDASEAAKRYQQAAKLGNAVAAYNLGLCYSYGVGVAKNETTARQWLRSAANQGDDTAKQYLETLDK